MSNNISFKNANIVLASEVVEGDLAIRDGVIADISSSASTLDDAIDMEGDYLLPGLVDLHTDNLERHLSPRPGVRWNVQLALQAHDALVVAGGITTVLDALCVGSTVRKPERNQFLEPSVVGISHAKAAGFLRADHFVHLRCETTDKDVLNYFARSIDNPLIKLVSVMDHAPGHRQAADITKFRNEQYAEYGLTADNLDAQIRAWQADSEALSPAHRVFITQNALQRGLITASHDDQTDEHVQEAKSLGISVSEFPTTMLAAQAARGAGLSILMGGPNVVRGGSHSGNVSAIDLARAGLLDILASDYVPGSLLPAAFELVAEGGLDLPAAVRIISANPAAALGLHDRGAIEIGRRGDLIRVGIFGGKPVVRGAWREGRQIH